MNCEHVQAPWYPLSGRPDEYMLALQEADQWVEGLGALFAQ
jgi:hypothetical protein